MLDLISIIPYDLISWGMANSDSFTAQQTQNIKILRIMRVLRILKLTRVFRASRIIKRWNAILGLPIAVTQLSKYALFIIMLSHWMACLWGCIAQYEDNIVNWEDIYQVNSTSSSTLYIASLYWSVMTIGTIGYGDVPIVSNTEKIVAILCMTIGCATYSFIIGSVCGLDHLNTFMEREDIPPEMVFRLREYFLHRRDLLLHKYFSRVVSNLSPGLQGELSVFTTGEWVEMIPFFMGGPPGEHVRFITAISQRLEAELYPPQELIVRAGEHSPKMHIIIKGLVAQRGRILHQGQIFGHHMLLNTIDTRTIHDTRTLTYVDAFSFSRTDLDEILDSHHYPNKRKTIRKATALIALNRQLRLVYLELIAFRALQENLTPKEETYWLRHRLLGDHRTKTTQARLQESLQLMHDAIDAIETTIKLDASIKRVEQSFVALSLIRTSISLIDDTTRFFASN
ncbi:voltage-gated ion channel superfamily [Thraustotheca clavata]|uniref:Voltage-gated ion channel superfamily n=1 Tax=Thraustotheca clavata TaxID=74557 RepID=A0A1V9ZDD8_9STRA|nr:voltage-gated ion channel superfamily [Thraustotheca clavata]